MYLAGIKRERERVWREFGFTNAIVLTIGHHVFSLFID